MVASSADAALKPNLSPARGPFACADGTSKAGKMVGMGYGTFSK